MSRYCPHCKKSVKHKVQCKMFDPVVENEHQAKLRRENEIRETRLREEQERQQRFQAEVARFKEQFPMIWDHFKTKFDEYDYGDRGCNCRSCNQGSY